MLNERIKMNTVLSLTLIYIMIGVSIHFLMPIHLINPYEYFYGSELKEFQVYQIFFGGVLLPLASLSVGYTVTKIKNVVQPLVLSLLVLFFVTLVFNGQDILFLAVISGFIVLLLRNRSILVTLVVMTLLIMTHVFLNAVIPALNALNTSNIVYSAIQRFNDYVSIFRTTDIIEYARLNISTLQDYPLLRLLMFLSIPSALIGSTVARWRLKEVCSNLMLGTIISVLLVGGLVVKMIEILSLGAMSGTIIGEYIGGPILAIGIFLLFYMLSEYMPLKIGKVISGLGNKAVFSYFMYSIIMMLIFYGIGFNLYGEVTIFLTASIAIIVTVLIAMTSKLLTKY